MLDGEGRVLEVRTPNRRRRDDRSDQPLRRPRDCSCAAASRDRRPPRRSRRLRRGRPSVSMEYDALGRVVRTTRPDGAVSHADLPPGRDRGGGRGGHPNRAGCDPHRDGHPSRRSTRPGGWCGPRSGSAPARSSPPTATTSRARRSSTSMPSARAPSSTTTCSGAVVRVQRPEATRIAVLDASGNVVEARTGSSTVLRTFDLADRPTEVRHDSAGSSTRGHLHVPRPRNAARRRGRGDGRRSARPGRRRGGHDDPRLRPARAGHQQDDAPRWRARDPAGHDLPIRRAHRHDHLPGGTHDRLLLRSRRPARRRRWGDRRRRLRRRRPPDPHPLRQRRRAGRASRRPDRLAERIHGHRSRAARSATSAIGTTGRGLVEITSPDPALRWTYSHDDLYRLVGRHRRGRDVAYTYDDAGNLLSRQRSRRLHLRGRGRAGDLPHRRRGPTATASTTVATSPPRRGASTRSTPRAGCAGSTSPPAGYEELTYAHHGSSSGAAESTPPAPSPSRSAPTGCCGSRTASWWCSSPTASGSWPTSGPASGRGSTPTTSARWSS